MPRNGGPGWSTSSCDYDDSLSARLTSVPSTNQGLNWILPFITKGRRYYAGSLTFNRADCFLKFVFSPLYKTRRVELFTKDPIYRLCGQSEKPVIVFECEPMEVGRRRLCCIQNQTRIPWPRQLMLEIVRDAYLRINVVREVISTKSPLGPQHTTIYKIDRILFRTWWALVCKDTAGSSSILITSSDQTAKTRT